MEKELRLIIDDIKRTRCLSRDQLRQVLECESEYEEYLFESARQVAEKTFMKDIYLRGLHQKKSEMRYIKSLRK